MEKVGNTLVRLIHLICQKNQSTYYYHFLVVNRKSRPIYLCPWVIKLLFSVSSLSQACLRCSTNTAQMRLIILQNITEYLVRPSLNFISI